MLALTDVAEWFSRRLFNNALLPLRYARFSEGVAFQAEQFVHLRLATIKLIARSGVLRVPTM